MIPLHKSNHIQRVPYESLSGKPLCIDGEDNLRDNPDLNAFLVFDLICKCRLPPVVFDLMICKCRLPPFLNVSSMRTFDRRNLKNTNLVNPNQFLNQIVFVL